MIDIMTPADALRGDAYATMSVVDPNHIDAVDGVKVVDARLGDRPESLWYGHLIVVFEHENTYYKAYFKIHLPGQRPQDANHMTELAELQVKQFGGMKYLDSVDTGFGRRAFWDMTPTKSLTGDDRTLRELMLALKRYSVRNQLCRKLRKTDTAYEARMAQN